MEFVRAMQLMSEGSNHILTVFKVTPTIRRFRLIMSIRVTYEIGHGEKVVDVMKQKEDNIRFTVYGKDIAEKNRQLYELTKDKARLDTDENLYLLAFDFYDITTEDIDKMSITYGLWESNHPDTRNETRYDFSVDQMK